MLSIQKLSCSYGQAPVLHDISIEVAAGKVSVILGPNGAGKSTLLKAIMGHMPVVSCQRISVAGGRSLDRLPMHAVARMGVAYVPEGRGILNSLTVLENLQLGLSLLRIRSPKEGAEAALDKVLESFPMLKDRTHVAAGLLSGGQQQMLAIARALISNPSVLLLDEPSLGLAPLIRLDIARLLREIADSKNVAVLLAEQDITLAQRCADQAYVLRRGRIVSEMAGGELIDRERLRQFYLGSAPAAS